MKPTQESDQILWGDLPAGFGQPSSGPKLAVKEIFNFVFNANYLKNES
jgi:hypothetical protein